MEAKKTDAKTVRLLSAMEMGWLVLTVRMTHQDSQLKNCCSQIGQWGVSMTAIG